MCEASCASVIMGAIAYSIFFPRVPHRRKNKASRKNIFILFYYFFPFTLLYEELECEMEEAAVAAGFSGVRLHSSLPLDPGVYA